jgi:MFS family permease
MSQNETSRSNWLALFVIGSAACLNAYDLSSMAVAMASIRNSLSFSPAEVPWINGAYSLAFGGFLLLGGRLGDVHGRRRIILFGSVLSAGCSVLSALSPHPVPFLIAQVCKGVGAALMVPNVYALINNLFDAGNARHKALAVFAFCGEGGFAAGNFFGGVLSNYSWRLVFAPSIVLGVSVAFIAYGCLPNTVHKKPSGGLDILGAFLSSLGFAASILAITNCLDLGIRSPVTLSFLGAAVVLLGAFVWRMWHHEAPLVPPQFLRNRYVLGAAGVAFFFMGGGMGIFVQLVLFMQDVLKYSPEATGTALIPFVMMTLTSAYLIDRFLNGLGFRTTILCGLGSIFICFPFFAGLGPHSTYWGAIFPIMVWFNLSYPLPGYGVRPPAGMGVAPEGQGTAYALHLSVEQFGITFGVTTASAASAAASHGERTMPALVHGFHVAAGLAAAYIAIAFLIATVAFARVGKVPLLAGISPVAAE